jgi:SAM-dependent methyltransferase
MIGSSPADRWADGGAYEAFIGRWSRLVAADFVDWLAVPRGVAWLDAGCGTGALTRSILDAGAESVVGVDLSSAFLEHARAQIGDARARFEVGNLVQLPLPSRSVGAVGSALVLNFVPDPAAAVAEFVRVLHPGGIAGCYVWQYGGGMELLDTFWSAATAVDPAAADLDEASRFAGICAPRPLEALFRDAGMGSVEVAVFDVPARFADAAEAWRPFLGGQGPAPTYLLSLDDDARERVRREFTARLHPEADGSVTLSLRAVAVRGRAPA